MFSRSNAARTSSKRSFCDVGGARHDPLVERLEPPAVLDQLGGQPFEQLGVGRALALRAEVVGGGDDPAAEVVLPEPIDGDARRQRPGPRLRVGEPVRQCCAIEAGARPARGRLDAPGRGVAAVLHQHAEEAGIRRALLLVDVAAAEDVGLRVEVRKAAVVGVVLGVREALAGDLHLGRRCLG